MIEFPCRSCGQKLNVKEEQSGKRIKCPKCGSVGVAPDSSDKIKFHCESCGQSISVLRIHAGKKGKCPKCKASIVVPSPTIEPAGSAASGPSIPSGADEDQYEHKSDLTEEGKGMDRRLILVICATAAVVVAGLIILVAVILRSGSRPVEEPDMSRREMAVDSPSGPVASDSQLTGTSTPGSVKEDVAPKEPAKSSAAASEDARNHDLKLRLKTGERHRLQLYREYNGVITVKGQQHDSSDIYTTGLECEVEQVDANGVTLLKMTYLTFKAINKTPRGQSEYDSTKPDTIGEYAYGAILSAMIGQSFVVKVTPQGKIAELDGLDEMHQRMAETVVENEDKATMQSYAREQAATAEQDAKRRIDSVNQKYGSREKRIEATREKLVNGPHSGEKYVKEMVNNVIMSFPGGLVGIGDSWQAWTALFSLGDTELDDCTYTLRENKQAAVSVDISSKVEVDKDEPIDSKDASAGSSRTTLSGSCQGSLEIDPRTGWMLHKNVTLRCSGETKRSPTKQRPQGSTTAISMEIVTTVEPID